MTRFECFYVYGWGAVVGAGLAGAGSLAGLALATVAAGLWASVGIGYAVRATLAPGRSDDAEPRSF